MIRVVKQRNGKVDQKRMGERGGKVIKELF